MKILVTGAKGFVGRNLCLELNNIREGKARCWGQFTIVEKPLLKLVGKFILKTVKIHGSDVCPYLYGKM